MWRCWLPFPANTVSPIISTGMEREMSRENPKRYPKLNKFCQFEGEIIESKSWKSLKGYIVRDVFLLLLLKLYWRKVKGGKRRGKKNYQMTNNGEITLTYPEVRHRLGITNQSFLSAKKQLVEAGFIDIEDPGNWYFGEATKFSISERWRDYGTSKFVFKTIESSPPSGGEKFKSKEKMRKVPPRVPAINRTRSIRIEPTDSNKIERVRNLIEVPRSIRIEPGKNQIRLIK